MVDGEKTVTYNPCTDLSEAALRSADVDPSTKRTVTDAHNGPTAARVCAWSSTEGPYFVGVAATIYTESDARSNNKLTGFRDVRVGPRSGLIYQDKSDTDKLVCYVSLPATDGMLEVSVGWPYSQRASSPQSPPCDLAVRHATELEPYLPK